MIPGEEHHGHEAHERDDFSFAGAMGEHSSEEAFGVGVEAGRDMVKDAIKQLLGDLEGSYAMDMEDVDMERAGPEEVHIGCG